MSFLPEKDYKHTCDTIYAHFQGITNNIYGFGSNFFAPFLPLHPHFYLSIFVFTPPNDGWTGLYIKLWVRITVGVTNISFLFVLVVPPVISASPVHAVTNHGDLRRSVPRECSVCHGSESPPSRHHLHPKSDDRDPEQAIRRG